MNVAAEDQEGEEEEEGVVGRHGILEKREVGVRYGYGANG